MSSLSFSMGLVCISVSGTECLCFTTLHTCTGHSSCKKLPQQNSEIQLGTVQCPFFLNSERLQHCSATCNRSTMWLYKYPALLTGGFHDAESCWQQQLRVKATCTACIRILFHFCLWISRQTLASSDCNMRYIKVLVSIFEIIFGWTAFWVMGKLYGVSHHHL